MERWFAGTLGRGLSGLVVVLLLLRLCLSEMDDDT